MKQFRYFGLATSFLLGTVILIAAFIIFYSYTGCSLRDKPKENLPDKTSVAIEPLIDLK